MAFLGDLARQRSLASAAFLFLLLVDEIEGLVFLAIGVLLGRIDLFVAVQDVLFPAALFVAGAVALTRSWRPSREVQPLVPVEMVELSTLTERIGAPLPAALSAASRAPTSPYGR
jgi:hypothetical protein